MDDKYDEMQARLDADRPQPWRCVVQQFDGIEATLHKDRRGDTVPQEAIDLRDALAEVRRLREALDALRPIVARVVVHEWYPEEHEAAQAVFRRLTAAK